MNKISFRFLCHVVMIVVLIGTVIPPAFSDTAPAATTPPAQSQTEALKVISATQIPSADVQPTFTYRSAVLNQLGRGTSNILYAGFEIPYRIKNEIRDVDPIRGLVPGAIKGVSWCVARAAIGAFELLTFYAPRQKPYIEDFDTDWIYA